MEEYSTNSVVLEKDAKQVPKHGNIVTNLLRTKIEGNLQGEHFNENVSEIHPESDIVTEEHDDDSELIICYEPLVQKEVNCEENLMEIAFKLLEHFFYVNPDKLSEMMKTLEDQEKPKKIYKTYLRKCRICQRAYTKQKDLDDHKQLHFQMDRSFRCKTCRKLFFDIRNLKNHEKIHVRENSKCKICLKEFRFPKYLDQHMVQHHEASPPKVPEVNQEDDSSEEDDIEEAYSCDHCGKVFRNRSKLMTHSDMHFTYKPFKCKKCPKAFSKLEKLRAHSISHKTCLDLASFSCKLCGKVFRSKRKLDDHEHIHSSS